MQEMLLAIWHQDFEQLLVLEAVGLLIGTLVVILLLESSFVFMPLPGDGLVLLAGGLVGMGVLGPEVTLVYLPLAAGAIIFLLVEAEKWLLRRLSARSGHPL